MAVPWPQKHDILAKISLKRPSAEIPIGSPRKVSHRPFGETQSEFRRVGTFVRFVVFKGSNLPNVLICTGFRGGTGGVAAAKGDRTRMQADADRKNRDSAVLLAIYRA